MGSERQHNTNAKMIFITRATWQATRKGQGLMIMKNVAIFNVLKSTELGDFTWVRRIIAHHTSGVISDAFLYGILFNLHLNLMRGLFLPDFRLGS